MTTEEKYLRAMGDFVAAWNTAQSYGRQSEEERIKFLEEDLWEASIKLAEATRRMTGVMAPVYDLLRNGWKVELPDGFEEGSDGCLMMAETREKAAANMNPALKY